MRRALSCLLLCAAAAQAQPAPASPRPRIGLVLSGGGARGLAHVGVLKVLEQQHVPIDVIAGTSMGAIVGGLYASGMGADQIEKTVLQIDWDRLFASRVARQQLPQRRKEEDFQIPTGIEIGYRDGQFRAPQAAVSSRGLETLLRRYTLPVRQIHQFDHLPIPFRAVATDMENGQRVILDHGDLAIALRSSMSVPGVFPSTEVDGRVLGDGGLVDNLPVDVARAMGADIVIVVDIGTPLAARDTLNSALGLTTQMLNILIGQNVRRSLDSLTPSDVLIAPDLGRLTSADFAQTPALIGAGQVGAEALAERLRALALPAADYAAWREAHRSEMPAAPVLDSVAFEGSSVTNPARLAPQLSSQPGRSFDPNAAARDATTLAATGDYLRTDYHLVDEDGNAQLVFDLEDKPWGPNYLRLGLDLSTDFSGRSAFNVKISHTRHWLTPAGTEWRNLLQIGEQPSISTELYHPLSWTPSLASDWFVSVHAAASRRQQMLFQGDGGSEVGQLQRTDGSVGIDLGRPWSDLGELRVGIVEDAGQMTPVVLGANYVGPTGTDSWHETAARIHLAIDQLDYANFPQHGWRLDTELQYGQRSQVTTQNLARIESEATAVATLGAQTFSVYGLIKATDARNDNLAGQYTLGGFQQLSGYQPGQIAGNAVMLGRLGWYMRLPQAPVFARGLFLGATLEAGNGWPDRRQLSLSGLRTGGSLYLGADTGIGPMYLGMTWAPQGQAGLALFIGRP